MTDKEFENEEDDDDGSNFLTTFLIINAQDIIEGSTSNFNTSTQKHATSPQTNKENSVPNNIDDHTQNCNVK